MLLFSCPCFQINNPDMRVVILKEYAQANFPATPILDFAAEVEKITTSKVSTLYCWRNLLH